MRVLVAEDDGAVRSLLEATLARHGFEVTAVGDGNEALDHFRQTPFPIVVTDWLMPGMDGLELLRELRRSEESGYTYIIILTGHASADAFRDGMAAGADDFLRKPCSAEELVARLNAARRIMTLQQDLARTNQALRSSNRELRVFQDRMQGELAAAARVQESLLPVQVPAVPGLEIAWDLQPSEVLAGDILNVFKLDATHLGLFVVDVSGHGLPASLLSAQLGRALSPNPERSRVLKRPDANGGGYILPSTVEVSSELNRLFRMHPDAPQFFTLVYGILDLDTLRLRIARAGHPAPIHLRADGRSEPIGKEGTPIGLLREGTWSETEVELSVGDRLVLYSDGLVEAMRPDGEMWGADRLVRALEQDRSLDPTASCEKIMETVRAWSLPEGLQDDCSLLMIHIRDH